MPNERLAYPRKVFSGYSIEHTITVASQNTKAFYRLAPLLPFVVVLIDHVPVPIVIQGTVVWIGKKGVGAKGGGG